MKTEINLSAVSNTQYQSILSYFGLEERCLDSNEINFLPTGRDPLEFIWAPEKEDAQMGRCLDWFKSTISLPPRKEIHSVAGISDFLNYSFGGTNKSAYLLKGTTDIVIVPDIYVQNFNMRVGLQIAIQLKKDICEADHRQAMLQLIAASAFARFPVTVVLTDLKQCWQFMWCSAFGVDQITLDHRGGVTFLENILNTEGSDPHHNIFKMKNHLAQQED